MMHGFYEPGPGRRAVTDWIALYLEEDLGTGDITSEPLFGDEPGAAAMVAREAAVVAGLRHAVDVFSRVGARAEPMARDGERVEAGMVVLRVEGPARAILAGERLALNMVGRMSGIATQTRALAERLARECSGCMVAGTRKTTPGFRAFEKEAIQVGGGDPHRFGLFDAMMVKDNHRAVAGDVAAATRRLRAAHPDKLLEVEVESLEDALAAAGAGANWLLIDNQDPATGRAWAEAVWAEHPAIKIEASGGITGENLTAYGWADRISLGALTHHAVSIDFGLDWRETTA